MAPRDYKPGRSRRAPARRPPARWAWFLGGFACGLAISGLAYLQGFSAGDVASAVREVTSEVRPEAASRGSAADGEGSERPRFEFYTMLPEMEVAVPEDELEPRAPASAGRKPDAAANYVLQVASFRKAEDAERLKAQLALLGIESRIQTVAIDGRSTWHRVRVGPFTNLQALSEVRATLRSRDMEPIVLKVRM